jgi:hypothetical protein
LTAGRLLDVLNTDVDSLGDDAASDALVHLHTNCALGNVPNSSSLAVVVLVGHALVDSTIGLDINDITNLRRGRKEKKK